MHSGEHLEDIHRRQMEQVLRENKNVREKRDDCTSSTDMELTMKELKAALKAYWVYGTGRRPNLLRHVMSASECIIEAI